MATDILRNRPVYEQLCKDYLNLKTVLSSRHELLPKCKDTLSPDVSSNRKLSRIDRWEDLLPLLERRNLLSMIKVDPLIKLDGAIQDVEFSKYLHKYCDLLKEHSSLVKRFYLEDLRYRDRRTLLEKEVEQMKLGTQDQPSKAEVQSQQIHEQQVKSTKQHSTTSQEDKYLPHRQSIFALMAKEIGRDWNTFGRFMQLSSGALDEIAVRHPRDVKARIHDILVEAENETKDQGQDFISLLLEALVNSRRKDLKLKVEKMIK